MPAGKEVRDLRVVQLLEHEVAEPFVAPRLVLVADDAPRDDDPGARVFIGQAMDGGGKLPPQCGVEDFIDAIEEDEARVRLQPGIELRLVEMPADTRAAVQVAEEAVDLAFVALAGIFAQLDEERQWLALEIGGGFFRPREEQILEQRRFAGAGIAENDDTAGWWVAHHLQDWTRRLVEVGATVLG